MKTMSAQNKYRSFDVCYHDNADWGLQRKQSWVMILYTSDHGHRLRHKQPCVTCGKKKNKRQKDKLLASSAPSQEGESSE